MANNKAHNLTVMSVNLLPIIRLCMVENMTEDENKKDALNIKVAWAIYALITILVIVALVFIVAEDNEEKLFFSLMTAAASYVFRPTDRFMKKQITRFMGPAGEMDGK